MKTVNDYTGLTDSDRIDAALKDLTNGLLVIPPRKSETEPERSFWLIDRAILLPANTTVLLLNCTIKLSDRCRDNFFRTENCGLGITDVKPIENVHIKGIGTCTLVGADHPRATGDSSKVLKRPCPKKTDDIFQYADWIPEDNRKTGKLNFFLEHCCSYGTDAGKENESQYGDWRGIGILFAMARFSSIENLRIIDSHGWGISFEQCSECRIDNIFFDASMAKNIDGMLMNMENQDGIDLRNGCHNITITNISGGTGDDLIALTAIRGKKTIGMGELHSTHVLGSDWSKLDPDIHDIIINNVHGRSQGHVCFHIRLLPAGCKIWNVSISHIVDTSLDNENECGGILLGCGDDEYGAISRDGMKNISISDVIMNGPRSIILNGYIKDSAFSNIINKNKKIAAIKVFRKDAIDNLLVSNIVTEGEIFSYKS